MAKGRRSEGEPDRRSEEATGKLPPGVRLLRTLEGHKGSVFSLTFDPSGRMLATGSSDNRVILWDWAAGKLVRTLEGHKGSVFGVTFDPSGRTLASGGDDNRVILWDWAAGKLIWTLEGGQGPVFSVSFDSSGKTLASGGLGSRVVLWDCGAGKPARILEAHEGGVRSVSFNPSGQILASSSSVNHVILWDCASGNRVRTLEGHQRSARSITFDSSGRILASGGMDNTVKLWDLYTGKLLRTLEGHTGHIQRVEFSPDGRLLASKSNDDTIRVWRCDRWEVVAIIPEPCPLHWLPALAFHPTLPLLATAGSVPGTPEDGRGKLIHLWELDLDVLLGKGLGGRPGAPVEASIQHRTAKVILVGDTGVGKSGLANRLVHGKFVNTRSSHARKAHVLDSRTVEAAAGLDEHREMVLWDLAGQPAYRLVHQLAMDDAAVACVLLDARSETNPLEGAAYWSQALDQARTNAPVAKLLVPSRVDVGGLPASQDRLQAFALERGFAGVFPTSAFTGEGCDVLLEAIRDRVHWEDLPAVSSTETLTVLRDFVGKLKDGAALLTIADVHSRFETEYAKPVPLDKFIAYLQRLEDTDAVDILAFHSVGQEPKPETFVLLDPTRVDAYASALLVAARDEPDGPGHLLESRVRSGRFSLPDTERLGDKEAERHLLWFVVESLLARDLALREKIKGEDYVVFPAQCTTELKFPGKGVLGVACGFAGPVKSIYATLIAQLAHYEGFSKREFFRDAAAYSADCGGRCVVRLTDHANGTGELEVSFEPDTPPPVRQGFLEFVARHLEAKSKPGSVTRRHAYHCARCQNPFEDRVVRLRLEAKKNKLVCPVCEASTPLVDLLVVPTAASTAVADRMDANAKAGRQRITAEWVIKAKEAEGKYDVFLSHNSKDKAAVEEIARRLKSVGIRPWLDRWDMVPGETVTEALEKAIKTIKCAVLFFGPADVGRWHVMEIRAYVESKAGQEARFIPVILPNVEGAPELPIFVRQSLWVDMRDWKEPRNDAFHRLVCGILGKPPGDSHGVLSARYVWEWQQGGR
jgi:GTPase SAR1 family protein